MSENGSREKSDKGGTNQKKLCLTWGERGIDGVEGRGEKTTLVTAQTSLLDGKETWGRQKRKPQQQALLKFLRGDRARVSKRCVGGIRKMGTKIGLKKEVKPGSHQGSRNKKATGE